MADLESLRYTTNEKAEVENYGRGKAFVADLRNLSKTGALLEWVQEGAPLHLGDILRLKVVLHNMNRQYNLSAEVVWIDGNKAGVAFVKSSEVVDRIMKRN